MQNNILKVFHHYIVCNLESLISTNDATILFIFFFEVGLVNKYLSYMNTRICELR